MKYLIDTNILVHLLHGRCSVAEAINRHGLDNCHMSEITMAELLVGEKIAALRGHSVDHDKLRSLFNVITPVPITGSLELYAEEKARLRGEGRIVDDFDLLIACTAVAEGMVLVTENTAHMSRVRSIRMENWAERI